MSETIHPKSSALHFNAIARLNVAHFFDEGTGIEADDILAAKYYEMVSDSIPFASACYGWCYNMAVVFRAIS
jgi:TPR repeat protein